MTFTANENGSSVGFCYWSSYIDQQPVDMGNNMQYSTDGGKTWQDYTIGVGEGNVVAIELDEGETVKFRGNNENLADVNLAAYRNVYTKCVIQGSVSASGDVTSLLNGVGGDVDLTDKNHCYSNMFSSCNGLTTAPELPSTTLAKSCYNTMFDECRGLTQAPELPATTLAQGCYYGMFKQCRALTTAPELPSTADGLAEGCYEEMFSYCTSITTVSLLPEVDNPENYYYSMLYDTQVDQSLYPATCFEGGGL